MRQQIRVFTVSSLFTAFVLLMGCQRGEDVSAELDDIKDELREVRDELAELKGMIRELERDDVPAPSPPGPPPTRPSRLEPDPAAVYSLPIEGAPFKGARDARVTIVKGFEFACPFCQRSVATMDQLLRDYKGDVRIVYKHFIVHPQTATEPAVAACAAGLQGKFEAMEKLLWEDAFQTRTFDRKHIEKLADRAGLDMRRFRADRDGPCPERIRGDQAQLTAVGTRGTPSFYINGRYLSGARPVDQFKTLIDQELAKAEQRIRDDPDTTAYNYYDKHVLRAGRTRLEVEEE